MTDEEIIQDFKEIVEDYRDECCYDFYLKLRNVLDLIEKQQAEIDKDNDRIEELINEVSIKDAEIEKKDKEINILKDELGYTRKLV